MTSRRHDIDLLERWLAEEASAEAAERAAAEGVGSLEAAVERERAEAALTALFTALPRPLPSPRLSARLGAVADQAAAQRASRQAFVFGLPRRTLERVAASLLLVTGVVAALAQTVFRDFTGPALARLSPGSVLSSAAEALITIVYGLQEWAEAALDVANGVMRLSGAAATVAGTAPVAVALGLGLVVAALGFKLVRDLIAKERGLSHVDSE